MQSSSEPRLRANPEPRGHSPTDRQSRVTHLNGDNARSSPRRKTPRAYPLTRANCRFRVNSAHGLVPEGKEAPQPRREKLEIPADVWEKCEACGHTDIREKFVRNLNVCPNCDYHRRIRASEYCNLLLDDGTIEEVEVDLRSTDPLGFPGVSGAPEEGDRRTPATPTRSSPAPARSTRCR